MSKGFDVDSAVKSDVDKLRRIGEGGGKMTIGAALESVFWLGCVSSLVGMIGVMPWVGPEGVITGTAWLVLSLFGICFFGGLALAVRLFRENEPESRPRRGYRTSNGR